jgi:serine/threonine protein kinase
MTEEQWKQLKLLYGQARQLKSSERAAYLREACGGDTHLQLQVESLLENSDKAEVEAFMETPALAEAADSPLHGRRIAHYAIVEQIGVGGMGEVYRAKDAKLGRDIALKVLPSSLVQDTNRRSRFEREARLLAALNHPNIAAIYGVEDAGEGYALVLELVEGPTIADRLKAGPISVKEALSIARQIANALEAAHEKNIVHRDLKPANIKIAANGVVKVLDFGLAKALESESVVEHASEAPTHASIATRQGAILGTPAYMSPEQATGQSGLLDTRTDIWAFGCVLYEMLSGQRPFPGNSISETIAGVLGLEPNWEVLPETAPEGVKRLLRRCLTKDPKQRLHHIANARIELDEALSASATNARTLRIQTLGLFAGAAVALLLAVFGVYSLVGFLKSTRPIPEVIEETQLTTKTIEDPIAYAAISPDGRQLIYNDSTAIWIRDIKTGQEGSISGSNPDIPPDFCFK